MDLYEAAVERERDARDTTRARRRVRALGELRPRGRLQERVCSVLPWVARHGPGVLDRVLSAFKPPFAGHVILEPGRDGRGPEGQE